jgi:hypothetical protein
MCHHPPVATTAVTVDGSSPPLFADRARDATAFDCPDEVGAVRVKTLLHEEVDMAEVNKTEIDRNLLAVLRAKFLDFSHRLLRRRHLHGW